MTGLIKINEQDVLIKEWNGQRVLTLKEIDYLHRRPANTASRNFANNKKQFIEGKDYFRVKVSSYEIRRDLGLPAGAPQVLLFTLSGYLMLVKSFTDDLAWVVQRELVNAYFALPEPEPQPLPPGTTDFKFLRMKVDVPDNPQFQSQILNLRKGLAAVEMLLEKVDSYNYEKDHTHLTQALALISMELMGQCCRLSRLAPIVVERPQ